MEELGARRLDILPGQTKGRRTHKAEAALSLNCKALNLSIAGRSRLLSHFKTADDKPAGIWQIELRASPDLEAPPLIVVKAAEMPAGRTKSPGYIRGNLIPQSGGWILTLARGQVPALTKMIDELRPVDLTLVSESASELVFKLPTGAIPTTFKPHKAPPPPHPAPVEPRSGGARGPRCDAGDEASRRAARRLRRQADPLAIAKASGLGRAGDLDPQ